MTSKKEIVNERKKTSQAFKELNDARNLRNRIRAEIGADTEEAARAQKLVVKWKRQWEAEVNNIQLDPHEELRQTLHDAETKFNALYPPKGE